MKHFEVLSESDQKKILAAINRLAANNNNVVKQIERLADLKENEPLKWQLGLKVLKIN